MKDLSKIIKESFLFDFEVEDSIELENKKVKINAYNRSKAKTSIVEKIKRFYYMTKLNRLEKKVDDIDLIRISKEAAIKGEDGVAAIEKAENKMDELNSKIEELKEKLVESEELDKPEKEEFFNPNDELGVNESETSQDSIDLSALAGATSSEEAEKEVAAIENEVSQDLASNVSEMEMPKMEPISEEPVEEKEELPVDSIEVDNSLQTVEEQRKEEAENEQQKHENIQDEIEKELADKVQSLAQEYVNRTLADIQSTFKAIRTNDQRHYQRIVEKLIQETQMRELKLMDSHNQEKQQMQGQIDSLTSSYNTEKNRAEDQAKTIEDNNQQINYLNTAVTEKSEELTRVNEENTSLKDQIKQLEKEKADLNTTVKTLMLQMQGIVNAKVDLKKDSLEEIQQSAVELSSSDIVLPDMSEEEKGKTR